MTIPRMVGLLLGLAVIGIAVVTLRMDHARHLRQVQVLQLEQSRLRREIWAQDMKLAELRSPQMIRERTARFREASGSEEPAQARAANNRR